MLTPRELRESLRSRLHVRVGALLRARYPRSEDERFDEDPREHEHRER